MTGDGRHDDDDDEEMYNKDVVQLKEEEWNMSDEVPNCEDGLRRSIYQKRLALREQQQQQQQREEEEGKADSELSQHEHQEEEDARSQHVDGEGKKRIDAGDVNLDKPPIQQQQEEAPSSPHTAAPELNPESIYSFYTEQLLPALYASLPILLSRLYTDGKHLTTSLLSRLHQFLLPAFSANTKLSPAALWNQTMHVGSTFHQLHHHHHNQDDSERNGLAILSPLIDSFLHYLDTDSSGQISLLEISTLKEQLTQNLEEVLRHMKLHPTTTSFLQTIQDYETKLEQASSSSWAWWQQAWPMMDWKIGVFLWKSCSGLLLVIALATIVPGRMHGISGRVLRWPILVLTYVMIGVELVVYVLIRLFIKLAEAVFANSKHRKWRRDMGRAKSYEEWYSIAQKLDQSKNLTPWLAHTQDDTSTRYNWAFILELIQDLQQARASNNSLQAMAVLQQCTRKNVGGVMSEDLFSYTNTGETKVVVKEFVREVGLTLRWMTRRAKEIPVQSSSSSASRRRSSSSTRRRSSSSGYKRRKSKVNGVVVQDVLEEDTPTTPLPIMSHGLMRSGEGGSGGSYEEELKSQFRKEKEKLFRGNLSSWVTVDSDNQTQQSHQPQQPQEAQDKSTQEREAPVQPHPTTSTTTTKPLPPHHRETVHLLLRRARAAYGRTALCLSGGGMMGNYHYGAVKALLDEDILPNIISGTSAGSVVAALICTRTKEELLKDFTAEQFEQKQKCFSRSWWERWKGFYKEGCLFDGEEWYRMIQWFTCGEMTFEEAYKKTGRIFCITLSATTKKAPPVLLNYISAPHVVIASAIVASAAVPGFVKPVLLKVKDENGVVREQQRNKDQLYWDGSIKQDIPTSGLAEMLNCQFFIASQCNPHIVPFFYNSKGDVGRPSRWSSGLRDDSWRGGFLLSALELYIKSDMRAKFRFLDDLEAAVSFTSSLFTQSSYSGTTTIVPNVSLQDFFKIFSNPTLEDMKRYMQGGAVAAYPHVAMVKLHYEIARTLEECIAMLEEDEDEEDKDEDEDEDEDEDDESDTDGGDGKEEVPQARNGHGIINKENVQWANGGVETRPIMAGNGHGGGKCLHVGSI